MRHAGGRLIEQNQFGIRRQHDAEFDPLPLTVGELADQALCDSVKADTLQHLVDHRVDALARMDAACREPDVFAHAQAIEHVRYLGLDADAHARDLVGVGVGDIIAAEQHLALARLQLPGEHLEERAFSGTVRTDQATQLTFGEREIDVAYRMDAAKAHAEIAGFEQRRGHHPSSACFGFKLAATRRVRERSSHCPRSPSVGTRPFGTRSTKATRIMPRISGALANILDHQSEPAGWLAPSAVVSHWMPMQPTIGPIRVPRPPTMTQMMIWADCARPKMVGLTKLPQLANRHPAKPASAPPMVKVASL